MLVLRRQVGERWAGLWDFPRFVLPANGKDIAQTLIDNVAERTGWQIEPGRLLVTIRHSVTRFRITLDCYEADCSGPAKERPANREMRWVNPRELVDLPLSTSARKLARHVANGVQSSPPIATVLPRLKQ